MMQQVMQPNMQQVMQPKQAMQQYIKLMYLMQVIMQAKQQNIN